MSSSASSPPSPALSHLSSDPPYSGIHSPDPEPVDWQQHLTHAAMARLGCKLEHADVGLGIHLPPAAPGTVDPNMLERQPSTAPSSTVGDSTASLAYPHSDDTSLLDDYDLMSTPGGSCDHDLMHAGEASAWCPSLPLPYDHASVDPAVFAFYPLQPSVKCEDGVDLAMHPFAYASEPDVKPARPDARGSYANPKYCCEFCGKTFMRTFNYNAHMDTHDPKRVRLFKCEHKTCDKSFFRATDLKRHESSVHEKSAEFRCITCGNGFPRKDSLQRHRQSGCAHRAAITKRPSTRRPSKCSSENSQ